MALVIVAVVVSVIYIGRDSNTAEASGAQPQATPVAELKPTAAPAARAATPTTGVPTRAPTPTPTVAPTPTPAQTPETESDPQPTPVVVEPDRIEVPVTLSSARSVGSLEFVLVYNPEVLELMEVEKGELAGSSLIDSSSRTPGRVWTALINPQGISGNGEVARFTFKVITPGATGSEVTVFKSKGSDPAADAGLNVAADAESFDSVLRLESVSAHSAATLLDLLAEPAAGGFTREGLDVKAPVVAFVN